jgi:hypothetical protein
MARKTQTPATRVSVGDRFPTLQLTAITGETVPIPDAAGHLVHLQFRLPADLLISGDGHLAGVKYGAHAYDQWSVDELLDLATNSNRATDPAG